MRTYIFALCFFLFSLPNLSSRRLDVYHTSTHGVALVQIEDAGLKRASSGSLKIQDTKIVKKSPSGHHRMTLSGYIFATKVYIDNGKKPVKRQYLFHVSPLPSNRHHRRSGDCLEGKGENYQVCSVQYCVQQLCTVRCTHT